MLDLALRGTDTWLILPVHDSILIECPRGRIRDVAERSSRIMADALQAIYPELSPKVDVNMAQPQCWNKDGCADSLLRFLEDPTFRLEALATGALHHTPESVVTADTTPCSERVEL